MRVLLSLLLLSGCISLCEGGTSSEKMVLPPRALEVEPELPAWDLPQIEEVTYVTSDKLAAVEQEVATSGKTAVAAFVSALVSLLLVLGRRIIRQRIG